MRAGALSTPAKRRVGILFLHVFVIASCGLIYELLAGTIASYLLGDSVAQFSIIIGLYLSAMGLGAWLSGFVLTDLARRFIEVELAVALLGGLSAPLLFLSFAYLGWFQFILYGVVLAIGALVGVELPLLLRILKDELDFKDLVSRVLAVDYIGALAASLLFPMLLVPRLGLVRTSLVFGLLNAAVGLWASWVLAPLVVRGIGGVRLRAVLVIAVLLVAFVQADRLTSLAEDERYVDPVIHSRRSQYQQIVLTSNGRGFQLFLDGNLQFSSLDEYRYHEALVHPAMAAADARERVLILGGGDGLALREVLRYPDVEVITLVDLDPAMTALSREFPPLGELNLRAFEDPRVRVVNDDAMIWLAESDTVADVDVAIVDFPDPNDYSLAKLYTTRFYRLLGTKLSAGGAVGIQCTSPLFARQSYWCIVRSIEAASFTVRPYHAAVPSFGVWGFTLARKTSFEPPTSLSVRGLRFLDSDTLHGMFVFPVDLGPVEVEIQRLDNQVLVRYYEAEWRRWQ
jgi:spermidine synthase